MKKELLLEFSTALLSVLYAPLYETPKSLKNVLQSRHFMSVAVFCAVFVAFQSVVKAATWAVAFLLIDLWFRSEDEFNNKKEMEDNDDEEK